MTTSRWSRCEPASLETTHTGPEVSRLVAGAPHTSTTVEHVAVCRLDDITPETGVLALVAGEAVAVFRTHDDQVHALSGYDPVGGACVLARGIVGTRGGVAYVASPLLKQGYDLRTGQCLDDPEVSVATYPTTVVDGVVHVGPSAR